MTRKITGEPTVSNGKYRDTTAKSYQPLGQLSITYSAEPAKVSQLSTDTGHQPGHGTDCLPEKRKRFCLRLFASAPDSVIVLRLQTESAQGLQATLSFNSLLPHATTANGNEISAEGYAAYHSYPVYFDEVNNKHLYDPERGTHFRTLIRVIAPQSEVKSFPSGELKVKGGKEALILIANVTSFNGFDKDPMKEGRDYRNLVTRRMERAAKKTFEELENAHVADYKSFFDRVELHLGKTDQAIAALPTDEQLLQYTDKSQRNPELEALYFQYGRYLLISSSRTPGVPANLQGLWNERLLPPWSCNYTSNINLEENYWAAETANLSEMHRPLMDFIANLQHTGEESAKA